MSATKTLAALDAVTEILLEASVAAPIIGGTVMAIASIIKGVTGSGPSLSEIADALEAKLGRNDDSLRAEIARLRALQQQP